MSDYLPFEPTAQNGANTYKRKLNLRRLRKGDIIWLSEHTCREHQKNYLLHPNCFFNDVDSGTLSERPITERIGFLDIETTSLNATWGWTVCCCIKALGGGITTLAVTPADITNGLADKNLCAKICTELKKWDRLVGFYSGDRKFDFPFLRSRCSLHEYHAKKKDVGKCDFPEYMELCTEDLHLTVKGKLRLPNNSLRTVAGHYGIPAKATPITPEMQRAVALGKQAAINHYIQHCKEDCDTTEAVWKILHGFKRKSNTSI